MIPEATQFEKVRFAFSAHSISCTSKGDTLFIGGPKFLCKYSLAEKTTLKELRIDSSAWKTKLSADEKFLFVGHWYGGKISKYDAASLKLYAEIGLKSNVLRLILADEINLIVTRLFSGEI